MTIRVALARSTKADGGEHSWLGRAKLPPEAQPVTVAVLRWPSGRTIGLDARSFNPSPEPGHATPDWAKGIVWYQIVPDRFCNGDTSNDPAPHADLSEQNPRNVAIDVYPMAWTASWMRPSLDEFEAALLARAGMLGRSDPGLPRQATRPRPPGFASVVFRRRYGGDLQGIAQRLDHLKSLGVGALYLTPIFDSPSLHKYDAADHRHIDPTLARGERAHSQSNDPATSEWPITAADQYFFNEFLPQVQQQGFRLVLDGVWNHVGTRHWAFRDVVKNGKGSPYASWFRATFDAEGHLASWKGWDGQDGTLPTFARSADGGLVAEVDRHIRQVTSRWMRPSPATGRGIDGWRLDVAPELSVEFWRRWTAHVKSINSDAITIAEVWHEERSYTTPTPPTRSASLSVDLPQRAFDAQMNYPFARAVVGWLQRPETYTSQKLGQELDGLLSQHPATNLVQMNLVGSHDTQRLASALNNPLAEYDSGGSMGAWRTYDRTRPSSAVYSKVELAFAIQAFMEGSPMIYYGDEFGVFGGKDPDCRKPMPWQDLGPYADADEAPNQGLAERCGRWFGLRQSPVIGEMLKYGRTRFIDSGDPAVFIVMRELNNQRVALIVNAGEFPYSVAQASLPSAIFERLNVNESDASDVAFGAEHSVIPPFGSIAIIIR